MLKFSKQPTKFWVVPTRVNDQKWTLNQITVDRRSHRPAPLVSLVQPEFGLFRSAFLIFLVAVSAGILLMSLAQSTSVAALIGGLGIALLWMGCFVMVTASYICGLKSGYFLLSPRSSITAMIIFFGLAVTAVVSAVEFSI